MRSSARSHQYIQVVPHDSRDELTDRLHPHDVAGVLVRDQVERRVANFERLDTT